MVSLTPQMVYMTPPLERINWNATITYSELQWATMSYNRPIYGLGKEILGQSPSII